MFFAAETVANAIRLIVNSIWNNPLARIARVQKMGRGAIHVPRQDRTVKLELGRPKKLAFNPGS